VWNNFGKIVFTDPRSATATDVAEKGCFARAAAYSAKGECIVLYLLLRVAIRMSKL
jgi:hypothetical protein